MRIVSSSIENDYFADDCGCHGADASPAFTVVDSPDNVVSYALFLEDRDAFPVSGGFSWVHWTACNIKTPGLPENASAAGGFVQGLNSFISPQGGSRSPESCVGYCGMSPPNEDHLYTLHVYALDTELELENGFEMHQMFRHMRGHVIEEACVDAWYAKA